MLGCSYGRQAPTSTRSKVAENLFGCPPGTGHNASLRTEATPYIERLVKFYEAHLGASRSSYQSSVLDGDDSVEKESPTFEKG